MSLSTWAEKVVTPPECEPGLSLIPWIPHTSDSLLLPLLSLPLSGRVSTWQPGLHGANEPRMPDPHRPLQDLACELTPHIMFIKVGKKESWESRGLRGEAEHTHRGHFTPVKRSRAFSLALSSHGWG